MLFTQSIRKTTTVLASFFVGMVGFLKEKQQSLRQWKLTIQVLNAEKQWQQILASWHDIQAGRLVTAHEAFADIALLEETEGLFNE